MSSFYPGIQLRLSPNHKHKVERLGCGLSDSSDRNKEQEEPLGGRTLLGEFPYTVCSPL